MTKPIEDSTNAAAIRAALDVPTTAALTAVDDSAQAAAEAAAAKYTKPSAGVPASDLAAAAQASLSKADSAIQDLAGMTAKFNAGTAPERAAFQASVSGDPAADATYLVRSVRDPAPSEQSGDIVLSDTSDLEPAAAGYALTYHSGIFDNIAGGALNGGAAYWDHLGFWGYNLKLNGNPRKAGHPAFGLGLESKFAQGPASTAFAYEWYLRCWPTIANGPTGGGQFRPFGFYICHDDPGHSETNGNISVAEFSFQRWKSDNSGYENTLKMGLKSGQFNWASWAYNVFDRPNAAIFKQYSAAGGGTYVDLPYINGNGNLVIPAPIQQVANSAPQVIKGAAGITGAAILSVQDSAGEELFTVGGTPNNTTGLGAGWFGTKAKTANGSGFELKSGASLQHTFSAQIDGAGNAVLRQSSAGGQFYMDVRQTLNVRDANNGMASLLQVDSAGCRFQQPARLRSYANVAALPSASASGVGAMVHCAATTTPGGACVLVSDGATWKVAVALSSATTVA